MIICEVGHNHLGDVDYANSYVDKLLETKIDAITFQIREEAFYKQEEFSHLLLDKEFYKTNIKKIHSNNKKFGVALADINYIDFFNDLNVDFYKVIRNDINNKTLIDKLLTTNKKIYVSTGMSNFEEISIFFERIKKFKTNIILNHTQLSQNVNEVNLRAINTMKEKFGVAVSFGNHCSNSDVILLSLAFNPSDILFYVKGNKTLQHPDEEHAIRLKDLSTIIKNIKDLTGALGMGDKIKMSNSIN